MQEDNKDKLPRPNFGGVNWQPAVEIFSQVSGWIAGPIILALIVGKYLDGYFNTKPWIFLGLTGLAFFVSTFGIVKVVSKYMSRSEIEDPRQEVGKENK
ncbi:MAG: AtpZ/AtpI family protein [Candidatus Pacebacteria bacterium]|nr:AtpZ/AtpI family protein [Candidatus Paceibacterota bacterium]